MTHTRPRKRLAQIGLAKLAKSRSSTSLRALSRECLGAALQSAAARVCREAGARVSTNVFVRDLSTRPTVGGWRSLQMGCSFWVELTLQSTPCWCQLCVEMGVRDVTRHSETELLWLTHADARNARTLNSPEMKEGPDSSSLRRRWVGGSQMRHCCSSS